MIFHINAIIFSVSITVQKFIKKSSWDTNMILEGIQFLNLKYILIYDF